MVNNNLQPENAKFLPSNMASKNNAQHDIKIAMLDLKNKFNTICTCITKLKALNNNQYLNKHVFKSFSNPCLSCIQVLSLRV